MTELLNMNASEFLSSVLKERKTLLESNKIESYKCKIKKHKDNYGKTKYRKPYRIIKKRLKLLPDDWVWTNIDQITLNYDRYRIPVKKQDRVERQGKYPYYGASGIIDWFDDYIFEGEFLLIGEDGANLITRSSPIAFTAKGLFWVNNHAHVLISISKIPLKYIEFYVNHSRWRHLIQGSAQPKLNASDLYKIPIALPSLKEQQKIVSILENIDNLIQITYQLIEKLQLLKKGLMQKLFNEGIGHKKLREVIISRQSIKIQEDWNIVKLKNICSLYSENYEPSKTGHFMYVGLEHIDSGVPYLNRFGKESDTVSSKHKFYPDDILYGKLRPYLDKAVVVDTEGISSSDILIIRVNPSQVFSHYLINILHSDRFRHFATNTMSGTTLPRTNWKTMQKYTLALPPLEEQAKIIPILSNLDLNIVNETNYNVKLATIKNGLMQVLLTGKRRVTLN